MMKAAAIALAVLVGILAGFYGGLRAGRGENSTSSVVAAQSPARFADGTRSGACDPSAQPAQPGLAGRIGTAGVVTKVDAGKLTLHDPRCNVDITVTFGSDAVIAKTVAGQPSDLQVNATVTVQGERQADGSLAARAITIQPAAGARR